MRVRFVEVRTLDRLASGEAHQGVAAFVEAKAVIGLEDFLAGIEERRSVILMALDGVQDPHNLGAVIRSCGLCGAAVLLPKDRTAGITSTVEKVAAGALGLVEIVRVGNLSAALRRLKEKGFWVVGADSAGALELQDVEFPERVAVVVGEEHRGLRRLTKEQCDHLARIPSAGQLNSYNLGVAAGLFLFFAFLRQRQRGETP